MRRFYLTWFLVLLAFDTLTQVGFKLAAINTAPAALDFSWLGRVLVEKWVYAAVFGYLGAFVTYMTILKHAPIGPAFAATHMEIVSVLMVSVLFLGEELSVQQLLGGGFIAAGIGILAFGKENSHVHCHIEPVPCDEIDAAEVNVAATSPGP